ncbi:MAG: excinuclease ABC subunit UvrB [Bacteriovoracaceae bacterium]|jgi:excinuclease ABC subunit B|nr:excinuclease ABC subunit UvrB [Bacteriovoracaceae bacterium]
MSKEIFDLNSKFEPCGDQPEAIKELSKNFQAGSKFQTLLGVTGSGKTFTMANIIKKLGKKTLILAHNKTLAAQLFAEFKEFFPNNKVEYFVSYYDYYQPEAYVVGSDTYIEKDSSVNDEIDKLRHSATKALLEHDDVIVIASVSCIYGIGSPKEYASQKITIYEGLTVDRDEFLKNLVNIQYQRNDIDFSRGTFRVRGDTVEVFPAGEDSKVLRIEFFDDEIDGVSLVDPLRGSILKKLSAASIYPSSHYVVGEDKLKHAMETIKLELRDRIQYFDKEYKLVEKQRIEQRTMLDLEMLDEMGFCSGIENYSRHLTGSKEGEPPPTLIDYFDKDFLLIIDESHITTSQVGAMYKGDNSRKRNLVEHGFRLPSALDNRPLKFDEFEKRLDQVLYVSATPGNFELEKCHGEYVEQIIRPTGLLDPIVEVKDATNQVDDMLLEAKKVIKDGFRVLITTLTKKLAEELTSYYKSVGMKIKYLHSDIDTIERVEILKELREGEFDILVGINLLREGLDLPEVSLVGILDADKEGFLRSERSLVQTIGRAARNENGRVILYSYEITKSMQKAIDTTKSRRAKQHEFNVKNGITPKTIQKEVTGGVLDILKGSGKKGSKKKKDSRQVFLDLTPKQIDDKINKMTEQMHRASSSLDFELAASLRDEIKELNQIRLIL